MLKGIPQIISPELLKVLCEMGHIDRIVIADGNFPAESMGKNAIVIRCDGHGVPEILDAILAGDADLAEKLTVEHVKNAKRNIEETVGE